MHNLFDFSGNVNTNTFWLEREQKWNWVETDKCLLHIDEYIKQIEIINLNERSEQNIV